MGTNCAPLLAGLFLYSYEAVVNKAFYRKKRKSWLNNLVSRSAIKMMSFHLITLKLNFGRPCYLLIILSNLHSWGLFLNDWLNVTLRPVANILSKFRTREYQWKMMNESCFVVLDRHAKLDFYAESYFLSARSRKQQLAGRYAF